MYILDKNLVVINRLLRLNLKALIVFYNRLIKQNILLIAIEVANSLYLANSNNIQIIIKQNNILTKKD